MIPEHIFTTSRGHQLVVRMPRRTDIDALLIFVNALSKEDTFVTLSGEELTRHDEERYIDQILTEIELKNRLQLFVFDGDRLVANADIHRVTRFRKRCQHIGEVAISIHKDFRGIGLGTHLLQKLIDEAEKHFKLLILDAFSENKKALALYEKLGFKKAGEIPGAIWYKDQYIGQVHMYKELIKT